MSTESQIRNYILENLLFTEDQSELENSDSFLGKGIVDSTGMLEIILFIEETFDISVADEEMIPENLDSVDSLIAFIAGKQA